MVREMTDRDVCFVAEIESRCFSDPWSKESIKQGLDQEFDTYLVLEEAGRLCGYCVFRIIAGEGELLRIAVLPEYRGRGLSKKLMDSMAEYSRKKKAEAMSLEVRRSNEKARNLYESYGFSVESVRKDYYRNPTEDALIMWNRGISNIYH